MFALLFSLLLFTTPMKNAVTAPPSITVSITTPVTRQIVQRNISDIGTIPITGTYTGANPERIEASATLIPGAYGTNVGWTLIQAAPAGGNFSGTLAVPKGGWYTIAVRAIKSGFDVGDAAQYKIGVGDLFIVSGQSTVANYVEHPQTPTNDIVSALDLSGNWTFGADPQPSAGNTLGSFWPSFSDTLIATTHCPVGILSTGIGSTTITSWQPGGAHYNSNLMPAVQLFTSGGFRAFLWGQGESDQIIATSQSDFQTLTRGMFAQLRIDAGWNFPILETVTETYDPPNTPGNAAPIQAAQTAIAADTHNFVGANSDDLDGTYRYDGVHFGVPGATIMGQRWAATVISAFGF